MFKLFYKYNNGFYLNVEIYDDFSKSNLAINIKNLKLYFIDKVKISNKFKLKLNTITEKLYYIEFFTDDKNTKDLLIHFFSPQKELLPPWVVFPDIFDGSPRWNQAIEEDYSIKYWIPYWKTLDTFSKDKYLEKYNCNIEWKEWLSSNINYF
jgi:hypothetical protein